MDNPDLPALKALLQQVRSIAVLGLSPHPGRPSHVVSRHMQGFGFHIVPVRPGVASVLGETAYASLADLPFKVDLVNVFRAAAHLPEIVEQCIQLQLPRLWIQSGIVHEAAAQRAREAGIQVVMDRCIYRDYVSLFTDTAP